METPCSIWRDTTKAPWPWGGNARQRVHERAGLLLFSAGCCISLGIWEYRESFLLCRPRHGGDPSGLQEYTKRARRGGEDVVDSEARLRRRASWRTSINFGGKKVVQWISHLDISWESDSTLGGKLCRRRIGDPALLASTGTQRNMAPPRFAAVIADGSGGNAC